MHVIEVLVSLWPLWLLIIFMAVLLVIVEAIKGPSRGRRGRGGGRRGGGRSAQWDDWQGGPPVAQPNGPGPGIGQGLTAAVDVGTRVAATYRRRDAVLTPGELAFLPALQQALPVVSSLVGATGLPLVLAHVRLADLVEVETGGIAAFNSVAQKHVDFVLCDPRTTRPVLVIELDDRSHNSHHARSRDEAKDAALLSAGLAVLRVRASAGYDVRKLAQVMAERLGAAGQAGAARS